MTDVRTFVTFEADLPDDSIFSDDGNISVPGGRNVCVNLIEQFSSQGDFATNPQQHEFYGWEFTAKLSGRDTWMLLQGGQPWLLIIKDRNENKGLFRKPSEPSDETLKLIDGTLKGCAKFRNVSWFTRREYETGTEVGSPRP